VELEGRRHTGLYTIEPGRIVRVSSALFGTKAAYIIGSSPEHTARALLTEMVRAHEDHAAKEEAKRVAEKRRDH
jgi:hypothetical protein